VRLSGESVFPLDLGGGWGGTELGLLNGAAGQANEVVVMSRPAPDVRTFLAWQSANDPAATEQLDGAVDRREPETGRALASTVVKIDDRERAAMALDRLEHRTSLRSRTRAGRELEPSRGHSAILIDSDSHFKSDN
jgi:hypothetical protein